MQRNLWPKEHGAYAQLVLPMAAALASGTPAVPAWSFALAAALLFLAHEPARIALGHRGARAQVEHGRTARLVLGVELAAGGIATAAALFLAEPLARWISLLPALLATGVILVVANGAERSRGGEALAAVALASASVPVAIAAGLPTRWAVGMWVGWCFGFTSTIWAVRDVISAHKGRPVSDGKALLTMSVIFAAAVPIFPAAIAAAPAVLWAWVIRRLAPHPRHLHRVGWSLAAVGALTTILLISLARMG